MRLGCPAIYKEDDGYRIDEALCAGCELHWHVHLAPLRRRSGYEHIDCRCRVRYVVTRCLGW